MDLLKHLQSRDDFSEKMSRAETNIKTTTELLQEVFGPLRGSYLLFNQNAHALQRCREIAIIVERLYDTRVLLLKADLTLDLVRPQAQHAPLTYGELHTEAQSLSDRIALDFQTLLIFTGMLLDVWAQVAGHILGVPRPSKSSFIHIAKDDGQGPFATLWQSHKQSILWLDALPRLYRNKMIVHRERPWQMSNTRTLVFLDWSFWTPITSGWVTPEEGKAALEKLVALATSIGLKSEGTIHEVVIQLLRNGHQLTKEQRKEAYDIAEEFGFHTPSFQEFAHQLMDFLIAATETLHTSIRSNSGAVNLGGRW
ncbi:hypothetical protein GR198_07715 [Rhizobium leguminosarum]|uniref:hypothetical protein n=1 Tax=Rhizobium leguminosarum TaxID=384 RepID=UPI0013C249D0|nr:hypothetical protein [Rhizobium leguminosarum]NEH55623.1 hypothetical protein [Rhizobium leguminosarum]